MAVTINVSDTRKANTHHHSLTDGTTTVGLIIPEGVGAIQQQPYSPSSLQFNQGRQGYGSFEPPYSSIDQNDWSGGRGQIKYEDTTKFFDSYNAWTLTPGQWMPAPHARYARGLRNENFFLPFQRDRLQDTSTLGITTMTWGTMRNTWRYRAMPFTAGANYSPTEVWVNLRYFGSPGTFTAEIWSESAGEPNAVITNGTAGLTNSDWVDALPEGEMVGQWTCFHFATAPSLTSGTDYYVVVYSAAGDDSDNYFEIGGSSGSQSGAHSGTFKSTDGSTWASGGFFAYKLTAAIADAKIHFIEYKRGLYACTEPADGTAGKIYINGDRGVATGTQSSSTLKDTTKSWTTSEWANSYVHIWNGTGQGQWRRVVSNTTDTLTISSATAGKAWDVSPVAGGTDTGSEYVIVGSDKWTDVTPTGDNGVPAGPITDVLTLWGILYVAMGEVDELHRYREYNDSGTWKTFWGANSDTGTYGTNVADEETGNNALYLAKTYDPVNENFVWRARNENPAEWTGTDQTSVSKADDVTWGTDLTFGNPVPVGTRDFLITGLTVYNNKLWVGKENSIWYIDYDGSYDRAYPLQVGLEAISSPDNARAMAAKDLFLYFNWAYSVERLYGSTLDDVGPWRGAGMPERAQGVVVDLQPAIGWIFAAMDGGPKQQSSLMVYANGWHTLYRGPSRQTSAFTGTFNNPRIRSTHWQSISGEFATNLLWFEHGGDIMYMQMPTTHLDPAQDPNIYLTNESYIVTSKMDAGYEELEKHFEKFRIVAPDKGTNNKVAIDYDVDPNPYNFSWTNAARSGSTPAFSYDLSQSRKRNVMFRVRLENANTQGRASSPPPPGTQAIVQAHVLDAFSRTPVKYNWVFPVRLKEYSKTLLGERDHDPETLFDQLNTWAGQAQELTLASVLPWMDGKTVVVEPLPMRYDVWTEDDAFVSGSVQVTLRET